jgi:hypothetical protein
MAGGAECGADLEQGAGCGPDPDAWHGGQDGGTRIGIEHLSTWAAIVRVDRNKLGPAV